MTAKPKVKKQTIGNYFDDYFNGKPLAPEKGEAENVQAKIIEAAPKSYRFGENEYLFDDLETSLRIFSYQNESANRFIQYLANYGEQQAENDLPGAMFNFPTANAYKADLRIADAVLMHERGEITANELKAISDDYLDTHTANGQPMTEWMQDADAPLYQIYVHADGKRTAESIGNTIQTAITSAFWKAANPETEIKISKA